MHKAKMRIAFLIDQLNIGGTEKQLIELIRNLDKTRFEIFLYCLKDSSYFNDIDLPCTKKVLGVSSLSSMNCLRMLYKFAKELRYRKIDIIQLFFFDSTFFGIVAAKFAGKTIISSKRDLGFWYRPHLLWLLRILSIFIDIYIVNSLSIKELIINKEWVSSKKIHVIYNGISSYPNIEDDQIKSIKKQLNINENSFIVGIVANLNRSVKRVDLLVKAAKIITDKYSQVGFVIVGDGYIRSYLENLAENLGVREYFYFTGLVDNPHPYISIFDIGVLTSDSEGFSNSIIEYMLHGKPVIATNCGGNSEIIDTSINGYLFPPGDYTCLAEYIICLIKKPNLMYQFSVCNKQKVKSFSWDKVAELHANIYMSRGKS